MACVRLTRLLLVLLVGTGVACKKGDDGGSGLPAPTTTIGAQSSEQRQIALQLNIAATGMNLIANDIGIRTVRGGAGDYCRSEAPTELAPHRATLEGATDPQVRELARMALDQLRDILQQCTDGADPGAVQAALGRYRASFERLRQRIDTLLAGG